MGAGGMKSAGKGQRGKVALLGGLAMILVAVCVRLVRPSPDAGLAAAPESAAPVITASTASSTPTGASVVRNVIAWPKAAARDPFRSAKVYPPPVVKVDVPATAPVVVRPPPPPPVNVAALAREKISLKGTVQGERSLAMINGRLYRVGQTVEGFRIVEIGKRTITVEKAGVRVVVEPD